MQHPHARPADREHYQQSYTQAGYGGFGGCSSTMKKRLLFEILKACRDYCSQSYVIILTTPLDAFRGLCCTKINYGDNAS
jgi:hypothetical protein